MSRARARRFLLALAVCAALVSLVLGGCGGGGDDGAAADQSERPRGQRAERGAPNFVIVLTDDQDWSSAAGMPKVQRLLARRGTTYENAFASLPLCCPSRATLVTGQYAHNHGVFSNKPPAGGYQALTRERDTLGVWLQRAGYRTAWIGKYLNGYGLEGDARVPPGWDRWFGLMGFSSLLMYGFDASVDGEVKHWGGRPEHYQTDVLARQAARFVRRAPAGAPLFLVMATLAPHDEADTVDVGPRDPRPAPRHEGALDDARLRLPPGVNEADVSDKPKHLRKPRLTPDELAELDRINRARRESLLAVDDAVASLIETLRETGRLDETVFVFTSDNGYFLGEHRMTGKNLLPYRGLAGVPLIVRGPGFAAGKRVAAAVGNVDLPATITRLAGLEPTREPDGVPLTELRRNDARRRVLLLEGTSYSAVRTADYLYVEHHRGARELYDLRRDPHELRNVADDPRYADAQERLAAALAELRTCEGGACRVFVGP
ncbi:MAG TPA: sulfatase [Solirubrobacterales bacterium]